MKHAPAVALLLAVVAAVSMAAVWIVFDRPPGLTCEIKQRPGQASSVAAWRADASRAHLPMALVALACVVLLTVRRRRATGRRGALGRPTAAGLLALAALGVASAVEPAVLQAAVIWAAPLAWFFAIPAAAVTLLLLTLSGGGGSRWRPWSRARGGGLRERLAQEDGDAADAGPHPGGLWATLGALAGLDAALLEDAPSPLVAGIVLTGLGAALVERRSAGVRGTAALWLAWIVLGVLVPGSLGAALTAGTDLTLLCLD